MNSNIILSIFVFYLQAGDFLTSLLQMTTSCDSRHPENNFYLFCKVLREILQI